MCPRTSPQKFYFPLPLLLLFSGTEAPYCWLLSATALGVSYASPLSSGRNGADAEGAILRSAAFFAEAMAYAVDFMMRIQFRKGLMAAECAV